MQQLLRITEIFTSVQGETSFTGLPTIFVRLAACNLRCTWCDTAYSFGKGLAKPLPEIAEEVQKGGCRHVCITGGEPLLQQNVYPLMTQLADQGFILTLETGGSLPIDDVDPRVTVILDVKCPKSGMSHKNHLENLNLLKPEDEVKFVIQDEEDFTFAVDICQRYLLFERKKEVLFSPVFDRLAPQTLVSWILDSRIPVRLNLQMHKYIWSATTRGV